MKIDKVRDWNIDCSMPQSDTFTVSLRKLNGFVIEALKGADGKTLIPADNCYIDIQRIGLNKKGKTLINRIPLHFFMEMTKLHFGTISNASAIGCYLNLGSIFLDEKDEIQVSLTYDARGDGHFYELEDVPGVGRRLILTTKKPSSIRLKISTMDANNQMDHSLRYDKTKDYERPVTAVEGIYVFSDDMTKPVTADEYRDMGVQFNRTVGDDLMFDFSTATLCSVMFNTVERIEVQNIAQIYRNVDNIPSSGRIQMPLANNSKDLTLVVVERVNNAEAVVRQSIKAIKEQNERLKEVAKEDTKDAVALVTTGAAPAPHDAERSVKELEAVEKEVKGGK